MGLATCLAYAIGRAKSACGDHYRLVNVCLLHLPRCPGECGLTPLFGGEYRGPWHAQYRSIRTAFFGHIGLAWSLLLRQGAWPLFARDASLCLAQADTPAR